MRNITFLLEIIPTPPPHWQLYLWNFWPPFFFSGITIRHVEADFTHVETSLSLHWWNKNYIGTMFGGSIYSMCDPMHMVMLMHLLGPDYIVRDKGAEIKFLKKGTGRVTASFDVSTKTVAEIWASSEEVQERKFLAQVRSNEGEIIAEVLKTLHIRRKSTPTT